MTEADARRAARGHLPRTRIPAGAGDATAQLRYIELAIGSPDQPAPVRDVLAWVVRFQYGVAWGDIAVDDRTGDFLRVEYSR